MSAYVIITPAHNEEALVERTIKSIEAQSVQPLKWVIVDDASTDRTAAVVQKYCRRNSYMQLVSFERPRGRHFGNKATAFLRGLEQVADEPYDYIGNLDADISLNPKYYEAMLSKFADDPKLGIVGGPVFTSIGARFITCDRAPDSVAGAVQLFRRACFQQIGGYPILPNGGIDTAAEITARMLGWRVRKFSEHKVFEHRRTGTATVGPIRSRFREGKHYHSLGYDWAFYCLRALYRLGDRPVILGSIVGLAGYLGSMVRREPLVLPSNTVAFLRKEQRTKLSYVVTRPLHGWRGGFQNWRSRDNQSTPG